MTKAPRWRNGHSTTALTRSPDAGGRFQKRHVLLAFTLLFLSACRDENDPVLSQPDPNPAFSTSGAGSLAQTLSGCDGAAPLRTIQATPSTYRSLIAGLLPGDRLLLAAGTYGHLPLHEKHGQPGKCIVVEGPASGSPAQFLGSDAWNIISLKNASYIALRNLSLDGLGKAGNGIKAEFGAVSVHHILIEGLSFRNFHGSQGVAISNKAPAWNWVVRHTTITNAHTGMYFGNSDGTSETANFLIEHNLVHETLGYNVQFKHQAGRNTSIGMPASGTTIIRHNTFSKNDKSIVGVDARPNLLVGRWPLSGAGSTDTYQVYGNLFYENPSEALFQGEGNVALHDNLFVNSTQTAVRFRAHNGAPRNVSVFNNTVVARDDGITITGVETGYTPRVVGNAVFALRPITLPVGQQSNNVTGTQAQAATFLNNPAAPLGAGLDLYPKAGQLQGAAIDHSGFSGLVDWDRDFNGRARVSTYRGAYSGEGVNPGWALARAIKPEPSATQPPAPGVLQNGVAVSGLSGATGSERFWTMDVPAGATNLTFQTSGGTGDADLYVRHGSAPTTSTYDCGPVTSDNNETCSFASPSAGTWHVMVQGYGAYSGASLVASYQACTSVADTEPNNSATAPQTISGSCTQISGTFLNDASTQQNDFFRLSVPAGKTVTALLNGLSVDYDLYLYDPAGLEVANSENGDATADQASWTNTGTSAVNVDVLVWRYSSTRTTYQLRVSY